MNKLKSVEIENNISMVKKNIYIFLKNKIIVLRKLLIKYEVKINRIKLSQILIEVISLKSETLRESIISE